MSIDDKEHPALWRDGEEYNFIRLLGSHVPQSSRYRAGRSYKDRRRNLLLNYIKAAGERTRWDNLHSFFVLECAYKELAKHDEK